MFLFCLFYNKGKKVQKSTKKYFPVFLMEVVTLAGPPALSGVSSFYLKLPSPHVMPAPPSPSLVFMLEGGTAS
jgi:hypothetical protein